VEILAKTYPASCKHPARRVAGYGYIEREAILQSCVLIEYAGCRIHGKARRIEGKNYL